jgi:hypothetical protein
MKGVFFTIISTQFVTFISSFDTLQCILRDILHSKRVLDAYYYKLPFGMLLYKRPRMKFHRL